MTPTRNRQLRLLAAALLLATGASACSDDQEAAYAAETIAVTAVDYGFEGLPDLIGVGSKLSLVNAGREPHELAVIRIPEGETRGVEELLALPEDEFFAVFSGEAEPETVILAAPGRTDVPGPVVGDGTLGEPGRYAVLCFIPVGSDPSILDPNVDGPPEGDGPPHATQGMWAEITVQ